LGITYFSLVIRKRRGQEVLAVLAVIVVLLLALILGGLGFAIHILWWIALALLLIWLIGWAFGAAETGNRRRWYGRW
jgi:hypothetical protein